MSIVAAPVFDPLNYTSAVVDAVIKESTAAISFNFDRAAVSFILINLSHPFARYSFVRHCDNLEDSCPGAALTCVRAPYYPCSLLDRAEL